MLLLITLFSFNSADAVNNKEVVFDGNELSYYYNPVYSDGVELIPIEALSILLNIDIGFNSSTGKISCSNPDTCFSLLLDSDQGLIKGENVILSAAPVYSNKRVYVPIDLFDMLEPGKIYKDEDSQRLYMDFDLFGNSYDTHEKAEIKINTSKNDYSLNSNLMLVNKKCPVPQLYTPSDLKSIKDSKGNNLFPAKGKNAMLKSDALNSAALMFSAAGNDHLKGLILSSGYRSYNLQKVLFINELALLANTYVEKIAWEKASSIIAPPGYSEHQTGLAMDLTTKDLIKTKNPLSPSFGQTSEGKWITKNSWKYGFVVRYTPDKSKLTGIVYEPWHLRYVGEPHAEIMSNKKMCLEEYLEYVKKIGYISFTTYNGKVYDIFYINTPSSISSLTLQLDKNKKYDISRYRNGYIITIERT